MSETWLLYHATTALYLVMWLSLPPLGVATLLGVIIGIFQALTQIQDQTLAFAVKLIGVILTIVVAAGWLGALVYSFGLEMFTTFPELTR